MLDSKIRHKRIRLVISTFVSDRSAVSSHHGPSTGLLGAVETTPCGRAEFYRGYTPTLGAISQATPATDVCLFRLGDDGRSESTLRRKTARAGQTRLRRKKLTRAWCR